MLTDTKSLRDLRNKIAPFGHLTHRVTLELVAESGVAHHGILASKQGKKASRNLGAVHSISGMDARNSLQSMVDICMPFLPFLDLADTHPALAQTPMIRGLEHTFVYIAENGAIGLTPSGAFKRVFVQWAAEAFNWPGHRPKDLYAVNKVLNEWDFLPLTELHGIMLALKIGRHFKGEFRLTQIGKTFVGSPGRLFALVAPFYLFQVDHAHNSPLKEERLFGDWDIFLNVINVEAEGGTSAKRLREVLYGPPDPTPRYDPIPGKLYVEILRPLCWLGLLQVVGEERMASLDHVFAKTPLWHAALRLDTDNSLRPPVKH